MLPEKFLPAPSAFQILCFLIFLNASSGIRRFLKLQKLLMQKFFLCKILLLFKPQRYLKEKYSPPPSLSAARCFSPVSLSLYLLSQSLIWLPQFLLPPLFWKNWKAPWNPSLLKSSLLWSSWCVLPEKDHQSYVGNPQVFQPKKNPPTYWRMLEPQEKPLPLRRRNPQRPWSVANQVREVLFLRLSRA